MGRNAYRLLFEFSILKGIDNTRADALSKKAKLWITKSY